MEFKDENKIDKAIKIWDIDNVLQIGLLSFNDKCIIIKPEVFNNLIANNNINNGKNVAPTPDGDSFDPMSGYQINKDTLGQIHSELNIGDAAWHSNSKSDKINFAASPEVNALGCPNDFQKWTYDKNTKQIKHNLSNLCLTSKYTQNFDSNNIFKKPCEKDLNSFAYIDQLWYYNNDNTISRGANQKHCLDGNGTNIYFNKCDSNNNYQKWAINDKYNMITHKGSGNYLDGDKSEKVYLHEPSCKNWRTTQFFKLFYMDTEPLVKRGFKEFSSSTRLEWTPKRWLTINVGPSRYNRYYRIFYRTLDDYLNYNNCYENSLTFDVYNNNTECRDYIKNNKKEEWIANMCIKDNISEEGLFNLCNSQLNSENISNTSKNNIIKRQIKFCKESDNLINNKNCKKFWNVDYKPYYDETLKSIELDAHARNLCKPGHNNYPFCNCLKNEKNKITYKDAIGNLQKIDDICLMDSCNDTAYQPSNYNNFKCPNQCIQNMDMQNVSVKGQVSQSCSISSTTSPSTTPSTIPSTTPSTPPSTIPSTTPSTPPSTTPSTPPTTPPNPNISKSLFNYNNKSIKSGMKSLNIDFPIQISDSVHLNEEDLFIILLFIIFIIFMNYYKSKLTSKNYDEEDNAEYDEEYNYRRDYRYNYRR
jgi:hypothetical protein